MADSNASFIPKNTQRIQKRVRTTYRIYLLSYLSYVFFFGTLIAVMGTYFYAIQVQNRLEAVKGDLDQARQAFSEEDLKGVRQLEKRLLIAEQLLNQLAAPSKIFAEVEKVVADNIKFIRFSYEAKPNQTASISLTGRANDFNHILFQRDLMNSSLLFEDAPTLDFDYSGSALSEDASPEEVAQADTVTLTFIVDNEITTSMIPYQPVVESSTNLVTEVRSVPDTDVSTDAVSEDLTTPTVQSAVTEITDVANEIIQ